MKELLVVLTPIALINSLWILPTGIIGVISSLGTQKPTLTAYAFIAGIFVPYLVFGLLLTIGVDTAFDQVKPWMQDTWRDPDVLLVLAQLAIGAALGLFGYRMSSARPGQEPSVDTSSTPMTPVGAFSVRAGLTIIKLPGAFLYFAAIDQILRAYPAVLGIAKALLYYNLVYVLPLMLIVLAHQLFGTRIDPVLSAVSRFFDRWGKQLMIFGLLGLGVVLVVDAVGWFLGFPLLPTYFL